jgi:CheY-like chemotaxis protein
VTRVVVADNDPDVIELLVLDLTLDGHEVVGAAMNGDDAVALCRELAPDVLVVDYRMPPGPDGIEVVRRLRGQPDLRFVVYSNYADPALYEAAARLGATYLAKGQLAALRRAVRGVAA